MTRSPEARLQIQLPEAVYDQYCRTAVREGMPLASLLRNVLIRLARRDFFASKNSSAVGPM